MSPKTGNHKDESTEGEQEGNGNNRSPQINYRNESASKQKKWHNCGKAWNIVKEYPKLFCVKMQEEREKEEVVSRILVVNETIHTIASKNISFTLRPSDFIMDSDIKVSVTK